MVAKFIPDDLHREEFLFEGKITGCAYPFEVYQKNTRIRIELGRLSASYSVEQVLELGGEGMLGAGIGLIIGELVQQPQEVGPDWRQPFFDPPQEQPETE